jgi:aryl-alcohol dehydrogenase-like predicted oxidoreductase
MEQLSRRSARARRVSDRGDIPRPPRKKRRTGLSLGMALIDTAEIYGSGRSEELIGRVVAGQRDRVFPVSSGAQSRLGERYRTGCVGPFEQWSKARLGYQRSHHHSG